MSTSIRRCSVICPLALLACLLAMYRAASADAFGSTYFDRARDELVVTMRYQGTNPDHKFTLQWGSCKSTSDPDGTPTVDVLVLDDQFRDSAQQDYQVVQRFSLADMSCSRPVTMNLYTAPRVFLPVVIPR
jgi:hypothetical protein